MKKVLNIIGKRPKGGIGAVVYNYQSHFTSDNLQIDYLLFSEEETGAFDEKVRKLGSQVFVLPELRNSRLITLWYEIDKFMQLHANEYVAIHLHSVNIGFMCFPLARKYSNAKLIAHSHATVYSDKKINAIRNKILCMNLLKQADIYMACSKAAGEFLYGSKNMFQVHVFNNAIECEKFAYNAYIREKVRRELDVSDSFVIGHVGRFNEQKNHTFLIDIFEEIVRMNPHSKLILVGEGPLERLIIDKIQSKRLEDKVLLLGQRTDVPELLQAMDVFLLPSLFEGLPVIGVEAQAAGLPCVVSDTVTRELDIASVTFMSLKNSAEEWARIVLNSKNANREVASRQVADAGYSISIEAPKLEALYLNM